MLHFMLLVQIYKYIKRICIIRKADTPIDHLIVILASSQHGYEKENMSLLSHNQREKHGARRVFLYCVLIIATNFR